MHNYSLLLNGLIKLTFQIIFVSFISDCTSPAEHDANNKSLIGRWSLVRIEKSDGTKALVGNCTDPVALLEIRDTCILFVEPSPEHYDNCLWKDTLFGKIIADTFQIKIPPELLPNYGYITFIGDSAVYVTTISNNENRMYLCEYSTTQFPSTWPSVDCEK